MADAIERARECLIREGMHEDTDTAIGLVPYAVVVRAMLAFAQQAPGMVLVPREPTEAMLAAAVQELRLPWKLIDVLTRGWSTMLDVSSNAGSETNTS